MQVLDSNQWSPAYEAGKMTSSLTCYIGPSACFWQTAKIIVFKMLVLADGFLEILKFPYLNGFRSKENKVRNELPRNQSLNNSYSAIHCCDSIMYIMELIHLFCKNQFGNGNFMAKSPLLNLIYIGP